MLKAGWRGMLSAGWRGMPPVVVRVPAGGGPEDPTRSPDRGAVQKTVR